MRHNHERRHHLLVLWEPLTLLLTALLILIVVTPTNPTHELIVGITAGLVLSAALVALI
jgi:hypothetical protein